MRSIRAWAVAGIGAVALSVVGAGVANADTRVATTFTYTGETQEFAGEEITFSGMLLDEHGAPVVGAPVDFNTTGFDALCSTTTGSDGRASCTTPGLPAGLYIANAIFLGDARYQGSFGGNWLSISPVPTTLQYVGATSGVPGEPLTLAAVLRDGRDASPIGAVSVDLAFAGPTSGPGGCTAVTDASGAASCVIVPAGPGGVYEAGAAFAGDAFLAPSSTVAAVEVAVLDADDDGLPDEQDPDTVAETVGSLDAGAFAAGGHRSAFLARLEAIERSVTEGDVAGALDKLAQLRRHADGCDGTASEQPDSNDWIDDCGAQREVRAQLDGLAEALASA